MKVLFSILIVTIWSCDRNPVYENIAAVKSSTDMDSIVEVPDGYFATKFDFPVGKPDAKGYINVQGFGKNNHLGDDWNAVTGGNTDLGDPIYAVANGFVHTAEDFYGGWGKVIRMVHYLPDGEVVESLYAHCDTILTSQGVWVKIGDQIGTIGNAHGQYTAHLHFEMRNDIEMEIGPGYSTKTAGYLDPTKFIRAHRVIAESEN